MSSPLRPPLGRGRRRWRGASLWPPVPEQQRAAPRPAATPPRRARHDAGKTRTKPVHSRARRPAHGRQTSPRTGVDDRCAREGKRCGPDNIPNHTAPEPDRRAGAGRQRARGHPPAFPKARHCRAGSLSEARRRRHRRHGFVRSARAPAAAGRRICPKRAGAVAAVTSLSEARGRRPGRGTEFVRSACQRHRRHGFVRSTGPGRGGVPDLSEASGHRPQQVADLSESAPTPAMAGRVFRTKRAPTPVRDRGNGATGAHAPRSVPPPGTRAFVRAFPAGRFGPTLPADRAPAVRRPAPAPRSRP